MNALDLLFSVPFVSVVVGLTIVALALALQPSRVARTLERRMTAVLSPGGWAHEQVTSDSGLEGSFTQRAVAPALKGMLRMMGRLAPASNMEALNRMLIAAGRPGNLSATDFFGIRILVAVIALVVGLGIGPMLAQVNPRMQLLAPVGLAVLGFLLPQSWLSGRGKSRREAIQRALPDALDMLTICVEAGLAFESSLQRVSGQWSGPLSEEFARVVSEIRLGVPRPQALRRLAERCNTPDVSSFVAVLVQADSMGTSIAQVLHSQADQIRVLRRQRAEEKANRAPILVMLPMVFFIFPAILVILLGPAVPKIMEAFAG